jgi:Flp pilus assembly protein TadD
VLNRLGRVEEALAHARWLAGALPKDPRAQLLLGQELLQRNQAQAAVAAFQQCLRLAPANPAYLNQLAWVYATHPLAGVRNGAEAVRLAEQACSLTRRQEPGMLDTLSAALAEAGRFDEASRTAQEARSRALAVGDNATAEAATQKLALYKAGQCYREKPVP